MQRRVKNGALALIHASNSLQQHEEQLRKVKPFYTRESLTPRFFLGKKQAQGGDKATAKKRQRGLVQRQSREPTWSAAARELAKTDDGQEKEIYSELTKVTNNTQYLICVYKEPAGDAFTIHSLDTSNSQQRKLTLSSDQLHLIVEDTFPLADLRSQHVWSALMGKYKLYELQSWEAIGVSSNGKPAAPPTVPLSPKASAAVSPLFQFMKPLSW